MLTFNWLENEEDPLVPTARELFEEYAQELGIDLCFQGFPEELAALPGKYSPSKRGALVVVTDQGHPVACGAFYQLEPDIVELKRIYVRPSHRGAGLGRQITLRLMDQARALDYKTVRLDTLRRLTKAVSLYQSLGYQEIAPYNFNPEPDIVYLERPL